MSEKAIVPYTALVPDKFVTEEQAEEFAASFKACEGALTWVLADGCVQAVTDLVQDKPGAEPREHRIVALMKNMGVKAGKGWRRMYSLRRAAEYWPTWETRNLDLKISIYTTVIEEAQGNFDEWIARAAENDWSVRELKAAIHADRGIVADGPVVEFNAWVSTIAEDQHDWYRVMPEDGKRRISLDHRLCKVTFQELSIVVAQDANGGFLQVPSGETAPTPTACRLSASPAAASTPGRMGGSSG